MCVSVRLQEVTKSDSNIVVKIWCINDQNNSYAAFLLLLLLLLSIIIKISTLKCNDVPYASHIALKGPKASIISQLLSYYNPDCGTTTTVISVIMIVVLLTIVIIVILVAGVVA